MSAEQDTKLHKDNRDTPTSALFTNTRYVTCDCGNT